MSEAAGDTLHQFYDSLWRKAEAAFVQESVGIDPHLSNKAADQRRGLSLIIRPKPNVVRKITTLVEELRPIEPHQYFYSPEEYHITVLSPRTATAGYRRNPREIDSYTAAIAQAAQRVSPFKIEFKGLTATPDAVMIQGFPESDALNSFRSDLRDAIDASGLPLHQRYPLRAAHITILRFSRPLRDPSAFAERIRSSRDRLVGLSLVEKVDFMENDWYMSADRVELLAEFRFGKP